MRKLFRYIVPMLCLCLLCACGSDGSGTSAPAESPAVDASAIRISEVMTGNDSFIPAADGEYYDWVELYNDSSAEVSLEGYYLSDDPSELQQFSLEAVTIPAAGYAIIYCSGVTGGEGEVHAPFRLSKNGESLVLTYPGGSETVNLPALEDDTSYALELNVGYSVCTEPTPGAVNAISAVPAEHPEPCGVIINEYMARNTYTIYDCESDYGDWLELYNPTGVDADLSGYSLSDSGSFGEWVIPDGTVLGAGEYMLIWCDNKDKVDAEGALHTSFAISETDTLLALYAPWGEEVSSIAIRDLEKNISCGYISGSDESVLFSVPTPGAENGPSYSEAGLSAAFGENAYISEVLAASGSTIAWRTDYIELHNPTSQALELGGYTLSQSPGEVFFTFPEMSLAPDGYTVVWCGSEDASHTLTADIGISTSGESFYLADDEGNIIDGFTSGKLTSGVSCGRAAGSSERVWFSYPTPGLENPDDHYAGYAPMPTLSLSGGVVEAGSTVSISAPEGCTIRYTLSGAEPTEASEEYTQPIIIEKNTVLRAACFKDGYLKSQVAGASYLTSDEHDIPIISVSGPTYALSDVMYVAESEAEYSVHVEYFDKNGVLWSSFDCGIKSFGANSRYLAQKGFRLALREVYGVNEVTYSFFPENVHGETTYADLVLRPSGQDQYMARLRDEMVPNILRGRMDIDYMEAEPCAVYINGEYWGLYYLREHLGADYLESRYGFAEGSYDLVKGQYTPQVGKNTGYLALQDFCRDNDLRKQENYDYVCSQVDIDNLIDFWVIQTFFANGDSGNIRCYKAEDGKWRWMLYDLDWNFSPNTWNENFIYSHLLDPTGHGSANADNSIIRKLLQNEDFLDRFITRYCYHIQHTFAAERTVPIVEAMAAKIDSEIPLNYERWGTPIYREWKNIYVPFVLEKLALKPALAIEQLQSAFRLSDEEIAAYLETTKDEMSEY